MTADITMNKSLLSHWVYTGRLVPGVLAMKELHVVV